MLTRLDTMRSTGRMYKGSGVVRSENHMTPSVDRLGTINVIR